MERGTSDAAGLRPPTRLLWDWLLALGTLLAWELRFGRLGPDFNSDVAVHGAMVLRPLDVHFIYYWGQSRLGSLVPCLGKLLRLMSTLSAAEATQLAVYLCSALALYVMLGLIRDWPGKLLLAVFCAFPARTLAEILLSPGEPLPALLLFGAWQLRLFLRFLRRPSRRDSLWLGVASGALLWAGEPGLFLFAIELLALGLSPDRTWVGFSPWLPLGAAPFALLIVIGKHAIPSPPLFHLQKLPFALDSIEHLREPLATLWPLVGAGTYLLLLGLALGGGWRLWRGARALEIPSAFAVLAPVPLLAAWGIAITKWYLLNQRVPRYFTFSIVLAVWTCALVLDQLLKRLPAWARRAISIAVALTMIWMASIDAAGNNTGREQGPRWQAVVRWAEASGCQGVIGDYWFSYPFFTLSEGRVPATPYEGQYVRSRALAEAAVRAPLLCAVPWWEGTCQPTLEQFGVRRKLRDEVNGEPGGEPLRLCRYDLE